MNKTELLKNIFDLAHNGNYTIPELPQGISREVVEKNVLYIELQNLKKANGDSERIAEIEAILYPPEELYEQESEEEEE